MKIIGCLVLSLCFTSAGLAKPKEKVFTILGEETITAEVERGVPLPAEKNGIKIAVAAFMVGGGELTFTFGFMSEQELKWVLVEDVSGPSAVRLVEDAAPVLTKGYWRGEARPTRLTKAGAPWVFARGDTTKVFRFTVTLADDDQPVVLYQPAVYSAAMKRQLQQMAQ